MKTQRVWISSGQDAESGDDVEASNEEGLSSTDGQPSFSSISVNEKTTGFAHNVLGIEPSTLKYIGAVFKKDVEKVDGIS
jgi:hypothetical protein